MPQRWTLAALALFALGACAPGARGAPSPSPQTTKSPFSASAESSASKEKASVQAIDCEQTFGPEEQDSLRDVLASPSGKAVLCLRAGVYTGTWTLGRSLSLRAVDGSVVFDAGSDGPVLDLALADGEVVLEGITLQGGRSPEGGAFSLDRRIRVVLKDCALRGNRGLEGGGALQVLRGEVHLENCVLEDNEGKIGGAIWVDLVGSVHLKGGRLSGNRASYGGAVALRDGALAVLEGVEIGSNVASELGGAALSLRGTTTRGPELELRAMSLPEGTLHDAGGKTLIKEQ